MGVKANSVPRRLVSLPEQETHFDSLPLRDQTKKHILKWLRVQDQKRPRRVAPTCLLSSLRGKFRSSKRPSVSWMLIRIPSLRPSRLSKSTAKSTQKCSDTPSLLSVTNSQTKKLIMPTVDSLLKMDSLMPPT